MQAESRREEFIARRQRVLERLGNDALVLFAADVALRNNDVEFDYRQDSDFYYLTGFEEPGSVLVLCGSLSQSVIFVRPKNKERETWDGRRLGVDAAPEALAVDSAYSVEMLTTKLADLLENTQRLHLLWGEDPLVDERLARVLQEIRSRRRKRVSGPQELVDARGILHELRLKKTPFELEKMRRAAQMSAAGHVRAMRECRAGQSEWDLQTKLESVFREHGARRVAYSSIVGGGANGTILHYRENNQILRDGDLVLIDAGAEYDYYAADITRTFPVSGRFSEVQKRAYNWVLQAQEAAIAKARSGRTLDEVHEAAWQILVEGMVDLGLMKKDEADPRAVGMRYYMHRTSHYLGMDVHDVGPYFREGQPVRLEPGMVITVEPGLYVAEDDELAPVELRGLGIRIEDDVVITEGEAEILTGDVPKSVEEIEALCDRSEELRG